MLLVVIVCIPLVQGCLPGFLGHICLCAPTLAEEAGQEEKDTRGKEKGREWWKQAERRGKQEVKRRA
jgi:hypothetical protein